MGGDDSKRCVPSSSAMEASSSSEANIYKKRKTASCELQLRSSDNHRLPNSHSSPPDAPASPEPSVSSAGTVLSVEFRSDRSPLSCCSSTCVVETGEVLKELDATPLDLEVQTKGFENADSTCLNFHSYSLLCESFGDSEELAAGMGELGKSQAAKAPPEAEIEEFFAMAEKYEQKRFAEKYNFDIVKDLPLEGRYQWVRLH